MAYTVRAKAEIKFKDTEGNKLIYQFDRGLEPFEIAKAMMVLHAGNNGLTKLADDMNRFFKDFVDEIKADKAKQIQAGVWKE
jgi:hypothetical protein